MKTTLFCCLLATAAFAQKPVKPTVPRTGHSTPNAAAHQKHAAPAPAHAAAAPAEAQPAAVLTYEQLVRTAKGYAKRENAQNEKLYNLSAHNKGGYRDENNHTMTMNDSTNAECKIRYTEIGFYFPDKNEWSWIWFGNNAIQPVRDYGKAKKMERLTAETTKMSLEEATELANAAAYILRAKGVQAISAPDGSHIWFVANESISCTK